MAIKYEKPNYLDNPDIIRDLQDLVNQLDSQLLDNDDKDELLNKISETLQAANEYTDIATQMSGSPILKQILELEAPTLEVDDNFNSQIGEITTFSIEKFSSNEFNTGDRCVDKNGVQGLINSIENIVNNETLVTTTNVSVITTTKFKTVVFNESTEAFNVRELGYYSHKEETVSLSLNAEENDYGLAINDLTGVLYLYQFVIDSWNYICDIDVNPLNLFFEKKSDQMRYYLNGAWFDFDINFQPINNIYINGEESSESIDDIIARAIGNNIFNMVYPVGSIYTSINPNNPSLTFGGTWVEIAQGRVLVGVDTNQAEFDTVRKTSGNKSITLTSDNLPKHTHDLSLTTDSSVQGGTISSVGLSTASAGSHSHQPLENSGNKNYFVTSKGSLSSSSTYKLGSWSTNGPDIPTNGDTGSGLNDYFSATNGTESAGAHTHSIGSHSHVFTGQSHTHAISGNISENPTTNSPINVLGPTYAVFMWERIA